MALSVLSSAQSSMSSRLSKVNCHKLITSAYPRSTRSSFCQHSCQWVCMCSKTIWRSLQPVNFSGKMFNPQTRIGVEGLVEAISSRQLKDMFETLKTKSRGSSSFQPCANVWKTFIINFILLTTSCDQAFTVSKGSMEHQARKTPLFRLGVHPPLAVLSNQFSAYEANKPQKWSVFVNTLYTQLASVESSVHVTDKPVAHSAKQYSALSHVPRVDVWIRLLTSSNEDKEATNHDPICSTMFNALNKTGSSRHLSEMFSVALAALADTKAWFIIINIFRL